MSDERRCGTCPAIVGMRWLIPAGATTERPLLQYAMEVKVERGGAEWYEIVWYSVPVFYTTEHDYRAAKQQAIG